MSDSNRSAVEKLVLAMLLSAFKKNASAIRVGPDPTGMGVVNFAFDGDSPYRSGTTNTTEELRPPAVLMPLIIRKLGIMGNLPSYPRGGAAEGTILLSLGDGRQMRFALRMEGHGPALCAYLRRVPLE